MGQVPGNPIYGLIGSGRVARHMTRYFDHAGAAFLQWSRKSPADLSRCSTILILIKDDAIEPFIREHSEFRGKRLIHFSGSLVTPLAHGFHPLMTFGPDLYSLEKYRKIPFICEKGGPTFAEVFPELKNPSFEIDPELKPLYHSLCVMSGNFTVILWQKFFTELQSKLGLPREVAIPYLQQIVRNLIENPEGALTGPIQRKDHATVGKNLKALEGDPFQGIYQAFKEALL